MKRIAVIGDISGFGRCSLTASIPVISSLGIECCPFPTAVLSAQTGYSSYHFIDLTDEFSTYENEWKKLGYSFDGILTGYIASPTQADLIASFIKKFKSENTVLVVDPVMADDGKIYGTYSDELCRKVSEIAQSADIITPNLSELCILADVSFENLIAESENDGYIDRISAIAEKLITETLKSVIVTGVIYKGEIYNIVCEKNSCCYIKSKIFGGSYSGTGDLFASVICAKAVQGVPLRNAVNTAVKFLGKSTQSTFNEGTDRNDGINFQYFLEVLKSD
ncbi:MAG: pyridoxamine kinase [Oscillospiraceae bacterium]|nr:pyridoxamine kinase [Oscillospiraceae bacterium]